ncbi:unnamed protein product [Polarella glacialis]|uniref:Uncharacterized protein n=1 Tax=Polarella glacialis TaxID=89957 RepID=A0A813J492_POLGL|nr:unnamed protein product [Polarella glacialis]
MFCCFEAPERADSKTACQANTKAAAPAEPDLPAQPLWPEAAEVIAASQADCGPDLVSALLVQALQANPAAAAAIFTRVLHRSGGHVGLPVTLLRMPYDSEPASLGMIPQVARLTVAPDLLSFQLAAKERLQRVDFAQVAKILAGTVEGLARAVTVVECWDRLMTVELISGHGLLICVDEPELRDETMLCFLLLVDAAKGKSVSLASS